MMFMLGASGLGLTGVLPRRPTGVQFAPPSVERNKSSWLPSRWVAVKAKTVASPLAPTPRVMRPAWIVPVGGGKVSDNEASGCHVAPRSVETASLPTPSVAAVCAIPKTGDSVDATHPLLVLTMLHTVWLKVPTGVI